MSENQEQTHNSAPSGSQSCCEGGSCCPSGSTGISQRGKIIVFVLIVAAAGVVLANSLIRKSQTDVEKTQEGFTANTLITAVAAPASAAVAEENQPAIPMPSPWKTELPSMGDLNQAAADVDAVFVFVGSSSDRETASLTKSMNAALKMVQSRGTRVGMFWLQDATPDYENLAKQVPLPCVLAMVKGGGMAVVSDEINETKLMQAFVTASRPPSACGPSGCGPSGCP
jgi:hypothetical protein